ncbi:MAG: TIGR03560 family F420-dependent LLM class oxidoreductase [Actinobacteria bacterium]|nr:TIGR03560 family F420-dependent LLM class oxidoreductase [Actinomycetota bacterium]
MRFGIDIAQQRLEWDEIASRARLADDAGFEGVWGFDHFVPMYGEGPGPCFEGWATLAALAAITTHVRLGLLVTGVTYRPPQLLATEAITIDHVSHGRVELAMGASWYADEHRAFGWEFPATPERIDRLDEALQVMNLLMTRDDASFEGRYYRLDHATYRPRPVQQPRLPVWVGASGERRMLPLVARHADAWHCYGSPGALARKSALLDRLCEENGRNPSSILRASSLSISESWDEVRRSADAMRDAGIAYLIVGWPGQGRERVADFVEHILPEYS